MKIREIMNSSLTKPGVVDLVADVFVCNRTNYSRRSIDESTAMSSLCPLMNFLKNFDTTNITTDNENDRMSNQITLDPDGQFNRMTYFYGILPLIFFCVVSVAINIKILMSVHWIRRPLSPTLHMSLSLAGADAFSSAALAVGLTMNSFIPHGLGFKLGGLGCFLLSLEAVRLGAVVITMGHLLALAINHYLGILRPLHYVSIMTHRITTFLTILLWTLPLIFFFAYFSLVNGEGFQSPRCENNTFLFKKKFRIMFSSLFFGPFVLMVFIYSHIFCIVKKHQAARLRYRRAGSSFSRSGSNRERQDHSDSQQMARNIKAIHTTLFILGSFVIGWMPAIMLYVLVCEDCLLKFDWMIGDGEFYVYTASNCLIILKTMVNPIIYAARMHEIQMATRKMHSSMCGFCENSNRSKERSTMVRSSDELGNRRGSNSRNAVCQSNSINVGRKGSHSENYRYTYMGIGGYSCNNTIV